MVCGGTLPTGNPWNSGYVCSPMALYGILGFPRPKPEMGKPRPYTRKALGGEIGLMQQDVPTTTHLGNTLCRHRRVPLSSVILKIFQFR